MPFAEPPDKREEVNVGWRPWPGGQTMAISCPIRETFLEGNRGGGKTEVLLVKYLKYVDFGPVWRGIIFRREYKHLDDLVAKSKKLFRKLGVKAEWKSSKSDYKWVFSNGAELLFRAMKDPEDYWNFHGHEYPFIAWEELTSYPTDECYEKMRSCNRCSEKGVPRFYWSSGNPFGAGHGWVKHRFIKEDEHQWHSGEVHTDAKGNKRCFIHIDLEDNRAMLESAPEYLDELDSIENPALRRAWRYGDWDIVVGGFLQGVWDADIHVVDDFTIPSNWRRWRAMDWGTAHPYSVGWYARDPKTGDTYRYRELYGWGGKPDVGTQESAEEVATRILQIEEAEKKAGIIFKKNPADTNLWGNTGLRRAGLNYTPAEAMRDVGVKWLPVQKGPGSRVAGAQVVKQHLIRARNGENGGFYVFRSCSHFLRTVPIIMPDANNWEDVDTDMEDHVWDEFRYSLVSHQQPLTMLKPKDEDPKPGTFDWLMQYGQEKPKKSIYRRGGKD